MSSFTVGLCTVKDQPRREHSSSPPLPCLCFPVWCIRCIASEMKSTADTAHQNMLHIFQMGLELFLS